MITKFILLVVFLHGANSRATYENLGEFYDLPSCLKAGSVLIKAGKDVEGYGHNDPSITCVAKGEKL